MITQEKAKTSKFAYLDFLNVSHLGLKLTGNDHVLGYLFG